jgi:hypothetical protein
MVYFGVFVTCPALRCYAAKKTESDRESIATLAGPNIYTLIVFLVRESVYEPVPYMSRLRRLQ